MTAKFFQYAKVDQGIMAINFRDKMEDCLETYAGNYFNYLICRPLDYNSPVCIHWAVLDIMMGTVVSLEQANQGGGWVPTTTPMKTWEHLMITSLKGVTLN
jgi:hypothetical protein